MRDAAVALDGAVVFNSEELSALRRALESLLGCRYDRNPVADAGVASWLGWLAALARPLLGAPPAATDRRGRPTRRSTRSCGTPRSWRSPAGWRPALVHDINNALLVAVACLDQIAETPDGRGQSGPGAGRVATRCAGPPIWPGALATFGRPDDGVRQQVDLNDIVRSTAPGWRSRWCGRSSSVSVCCPAHALPVRVDAAQIEHAILNLCLNARDAMPDGGTLHVTTRSAIRWTPA